MKERPVLRFAPSPNGRLHLGHAYSALLNAKIAERLGGRLLLRIEDIDLARTRAEFVAGIFEDLAWLGLAWELPARRQSEHFGDYRSAAAKLDAAGLLYPCFASRKEIEAAATGATDPEGSAIYPGLWRGADPQRVTRRVMAGEPFALRLDMARALTLVSTTPNVHMFDKDDPLTFVSVTTHPARWGDAVIVRKDAPTSYHLSVVVDDALQAVSHVVRGKDLEPATDLHRLLQVLLGLPAPAYHHHDLVEGPGGRKLSKSLGDKSLAELRQEGASPDDIRRIVGIA